MLKKKKKKKCPEKDHLVALAQHMTLTQARYYRVHDKLFETDLGRRAVSQLVALKSSNIHQPQGDLTAMEDGGNGKTEGAFKRRPKTGAIDEAKVKEKLSTETLLKERPISGSVSAESSRFCRKFTEEQANHLFKLTKDIIEGDAIKKEVVWQRVKGEKR